MNRYITGEAIFVVFSIISLAFSSIACLDDLCPEFSSCHPTLHCTVQQLRSAVLDSDTRLPYCAWYSASTMSIKDLWQTATAYLVIVNFYATNPDYYRTTFLGLLARTCLTWGIPALALLSQVLFDYNLRGIIEREFSSHDVKSPSITAKWCERLFEISQHYREGTTTPNPGSSFGESLRVKSATPSTRRKFRNRSSTLSSKPSWRAAICFRVGGL